MDRRSCVGGDRRSCVGGDTGGTFDVEALRVERRRPVAVDRDPLALVWVEIQPVGHLGGLPERRESTPSAQEPGRELEVLPEIERQCRHLTDQLPQLICRHLARIATAPVRRSPRFDLRRIHGRRVPHGHERSRKGTWKTRKPYVLVSVSGRHAPAAIGDPRNRSRSGVRGRSDPPASRMGCCHSPSARRTRGRLLRIDHGHPRAHRRLGHTPPPACDC
jgi:hypothetical protein